METLKQGAGASLAERNKAADLFLPPNPEAQPLPPVSRWPSSVKAEHFERDKDYGVL
jgi:hypothetical protein